MEEILQDKVPRKSRQSELVSILKDGETARDHEYNMKPLFDFIADMMEMAYIAGFNRLNLSETRPESDKVVQYGDVLVKAQNFVKDKGFKV